MKKVLSILTVVMLSFGLAACSASPAETVINEVSSQVNVSGATVEKLDTSTEASYLSSINSDVTSNSASDLSLTGAEADAYTKGVEAFTSMYSLVSSAISSADTAYIYGIFSNNSCSDCVVAIDLSSAGINLDSVDYDAINAMLAIAYGEGVDYFYGKGSVYTSASGTMVDSSAQIKAIVDANAGQ
ncbi:hypothetical protein [Culicoidibacter larvae]|uniref:Uncharacterized protein n=1 Tax=Culicoidibacter larvae TaxID=2579976 RepID=A0A5R8QAM9_9FIRM|nr:hypothetical protein [Culicoidibacter larvae]TLG72917.1 hypothetical protein FEZ08_07675 [Culicoidibacter larvae]